MPMIWTIHFNKSFLFNIIWYQLLTFSMDQNLNSHLALEWTRHIILRWIKHWFIFFWRMRTNPKTHVKIHFKYSRHPHTLLFWLKYLTGYYEYQLSRCLLLLWIISWKSWYISFCNILECILYHDWFICIPCSPSIIDWFHI